MKFSLKSTCSSARLGLISNVARLPDFEMETPHLLMYTKGGTVPHLTPDVIQTVTKDHLGLLIPISQMIHLQDRIRLSKFNIAKFIGMNDCLTYCSFIDPATKRPEGFHEKSKVPFFNIHGKKMLSAKSYMEIMETLKPDMFLLLADGDTCSESSDKRILKSFINTCSLFEECIELYEKSNVLKQCSMVAALEGGLNLKLREECSEFIGKSPAFAVVIDGFHDCSERTMAIEFNDIKLALEASLKHIPNDKLRIIHGAWNPNVMLDLINCGVDLFDSSYPFLISEQGNALVFPNDESIFSQILTKENSEKVNSIKQNENEVSLNSKGVFNEESPCKKIRLTSNSKYFVSLSNPKYVCDFSPILESCSCHTCQHHTKAYIHHLLKVNEMLGPTLLMIHNLHHYLKFLSLIRKSLSHGVFGNLKESFQAWKADPGKQLN